ncbi:hypothetical protein V8F33_013261 [Rhypophila sp. PSN 637]
MSISVHTSSFFTCNFYTTTLAGRQVRHDNVSSSTTSDGWRPLSPPQKIPIITGKTSLVHNNNAAPSRQKGGTLLALSKVCFPATPSATFWTGSDALQTFCSSMKFWTSSGRQSVQSQNADTSPAAQPSMIATLPVATAAMIQAELTASPMHDSAAQVSRSSISAEKRVNKMRQGVYLGRDVHRPEVCIWVPAEANGRMTVNMTRRKWKRTNDDPIWLDVILCSVT